MIKEKCIHEWINLCGATGGQQSSKMSCQKCNTIMTASEVLQLEALENQNETLKHIKGFQSYISIIAIVISFIALVFSILK